MSRTLPRYLVPTPKSVSVNTRADSIAASISGRTPSIAGTDVNARTTEGEEARTPPTRPDARRRGAGGATREPTEERGPPPRDTAEEHAIEDARDDEEETKREEREEEARGEAADGRAEAPVDSMARREKEPRGARDLDATAHNRGKTAGARIRETRDGHTIERRRWCAAREPNKRQTRWAEAEGTQRPKARTRAGRGLQRAGMRRQAGVVGERGEGEHARGVRRAWSAARVGLFPRTGTPVGGRRGRIRGATRVPDPPPLHSPPLPTFRARARGARAAAIAASGTFVSPRGAHRRISAPSTNGRRRDAARSRSPAAVQDAAVRSGQHYAHRRGARSEAKGPAGEAPRGGEGGGATSHRRCAARPVGSARGERGRGACVSVLACVCIFLAHLLF